MSAAEDTDRDQAARESPPHPPAGCSPSDVVDAVAQLLVDRGHAPAVDPTSRHLAEGAAAGLLMALGAPVALDGRGITPLPFSGMNVLASGPDQRDAGPA